MKQFSFNRFWQLLRSYMADNKKRIMILCGGLFAATLVLFTVGMLIGTTANIGKDVPLDIDMRVMRLITGIGYANNVAGIATMVILTRVFANMEQRSGEIQFLMLPATVMEKWLSRVVYVVLVGLLMPTVATYAGIMAWTGAASLLGFEDGGTLLRIMFDNGYALKLLHISYPGSLMLLTYAFALFEVAYFIYGGTVFRHYAWLKSIAIFFAVVMVIGIGFGIVMSYDIISDISVSGDAAVTKEAVREAVSMTRYSGLFLWTGIVMCVLSPVFIVLSYRRFGKRELESRKYNIVAA